MAHGVPVVAPRAFGLPDLVTHGTTGLLVEPGDTGQLTRSVLALLGDRDRLRRMGSAAADDVRSRLSIAVRNEKLLAAYQVGRRPAARAGAPPTS
jgi:glycosyltransferase involved in cell wall biosynthesis